MLQTDEIIMNILQTAKDEGNPVIGRYKLSYPTKNVAQESNTIFVGVVDSENYNDGYEYSQFRDMVEILIVTKNRDYRKAMEIIKNVSRVIIGLIYANEDKFANRPVIRNITPEYSADFVLTRGHILLQVTTDPVDFNVSDDELLGICNLFVEDIEEV